MDNSFHIRVPKRWVRVGMIVMVTALIVAPLTAIASHSFTDVPDSNTFHEDIAWLADADVTKGCNPPANTEFCPADEVTRGQMAAFMRRFSQYIGAEDGTPALADHATTADSATAADNAATADTVDGFNASDLVRTAGSATDSPAGLDGVFETVTIEAPVDGMLYVNALSEAIDAGGFWGCRLLLNGDRFPVESFEINVGSTDQAPCPVSGTMPVPAGTHTVELELTSVSTSVLETSLSALFVPFGGDGAQPTSFMATGHGNSASDEPVDN